MQPSTCRGKSKIFLDCWGFIAEAPVTKDRPPSAQYTELINAYLSFMWPESPCKWLIGAEESVFTGHWAAVWLVNQGNAVKMTNWAEELLVAPVPLGAQYDISSLWAYGETLEGLQRRKQLRQKPSWLLWSASGEKARREWFHVSTVSLNVKVTYLWVMCQ